MIGIVEFMGSSSSGSNGSCMDRKRRRLLDSEGLIDLAKLNPPKWHTSLKQHLNNFTKKESKKLVSLNDVTQLLVASGFVSIVDVYHLSQTCKELRSTTITRQSTWKALCMQEFPSGTRQISPIMIQKKGYKWLYREWKSSIHRAEARRNFTKRNASIPPPRLTADQIMFFIHLNGLGDRPLHKIPIVVTGNDLSPLLNNGKMTFDFPKPVFVAPTNGDDDDASMCCIYNEAKILSSHRTTVENDRAIDTDAQIDKRNPVDATSSSSSSCQTKYDTSEESMVLMNMISPEREYVDFGPTEVATYDNCDLRLRNSPAATEIKERLPCNTTIVFRVGLCLANGRDHSTSSQSDHTNNNCFVPVTGIQMEVLKYNKTMNTCSLFDSEQMKDVNGGVTILHYLSELQLS